LSAIALIALIISIATKQIAALEEMLTVDGVTPRVIEAIKAKNLTSNAFISAAGTFMAPTFIIPDTAMRQVPQWAPHDYEQKDPLRYQARFTYSPKGWTDKDICLSNIEYFIEKIDQLRQPDQHVLNFTDSHKTRLNLSVITRCRASNVILFGYPPNCTQPLDVVIFSVWKKFLKVPRSSTRCHLSESDSCRSTAPATARSANSVSYPGDPKTLGGE